MLSLELLLFRRWRRSFVLATLDLFLTILTDILIFANLFFLVPYALLKLRFFYINFLLLFLLFVAVVSFCIGFASLFRRLLPSDVSRLLFPSLPTQFFLRYMVRLLCSSLCFCFLDCTTRLTQNRRGMYTELLTELMIDDTPLLPGHAFNNFDQPQLHAWPNFIEPDGAF